MTIAACLFHGEVVFPRPDEIIRGRYVKRRIRRPRIGYMTNTDASAYNMRPLRITHVSRPCLFYQFGPWTDWGNYDRMRSHVRDMILDQPANLVRANLHRLERERRNLANKCTEARWELSEFLRREDEGFYYGWNAAAIYARRQLLENAVNKAFAELYDIGYKLSRFKAEVLPTIWPINKYAGSSPA